MNSRKFCTDPEILLCEVSVFLRGIDFEGDRAMEKEATQAEELLDKVLDIYKEAVSDLKDEKEKTDEAYKELDNFKCECANLKDEIKSLEENLAEAETEIETLRALAQSIHKEMFENSI